MADTNSNQKEYPHKKTQKEGLGFPTCRIVAIISLITGSIIDANIGKYSGKGTEEQALLRDILHNLKRGYIILADAIFSTYSLFSYAIEHGILHVKQEKQFQEHFYDVCTKIDRNLAILNAYQDGYSQANIATYLNVSKSLISKVVKSGDSLTGV